MTATQTGSYYRRATVCGASSALSSRWLRQVQEPVDEPPARTSWGPQAAFIVLDPTMLPQRWSSHANAASTLLTRLGQMVEGTQYELIDLHGTWPVAEIVRPDIEASLVRCTPNARRRITATITVRRGRLSLVVPPVLQEAE